MSEGTTMFRGIANWFDRFLVFRPKHTLQSVAQQTVDRLEDGTVVLEKADLPIAELTLLICLMYRL